MAILIDDKAPVLIQGITGREGRTRARLMAGYGANVVAGVAPGRGGESVEGIPVFDTVAAAVEAVGEIYASVIFVPGPGVKEAALEAFAGGVKLVVLVPDRVPVWDVLAIDAAAREAGARYVGPNTLGLVSVGKAILGMIGGRPETARDWFRPGPVGITSRSGGITTSLAYYLGRAGIGATTVIHVGGDAIVGTPHQEVVRMFQDDAETAAIVMFGEIGGTQEEQVAELIRSGEVTKPVIAYIGGRGAPAGTRFSHAGAIVEGGRGDYAGKVRSLREAGAVVVEDYDKVPEYTAGVLKDLGLL